MNHHHQHDKAPGDEAKRLASSAADGAGRKLHAVPDGLPLARDASVLLRLLRASLTGRYRGVPWYALSVGAGALAYFVSTLDAVPDFVPFGGLADDAVVLGAAVAALRAEIKRFVRWERGQT